MSFFHLFSFRNYTYNLVPTNENSNFFFMDLNLWLNINLDIQAQLYKIVRALQYQTDKTV